MFTSNMRESRPLAGGSAKAPVTVPGAFLATVSRHAALPALKVKREGEWQTHTWLQFRDAAFAVAKSLLHLGLQPYDTVGIMGFNSPEWSISAIGTILAGAVTVGIYSTNGKDACQHIAEHGRLRVVVCETPRHAELFLSLPAESSSIVAVVVYGPKPVPASAHRARGPAIMTWQEFLKFGTPAVSEEAVQARIDVQRPEQCCSLIYTSGTTGPPKAVMISHDNITWTATTVVDVFAADHRERMISYLPLSHIAAAMLDIYGSIIVGYCIFFAQPDVLKGTLVNTLKEVEPTVFFGVPRVYEKIMEKMLAIGESKPKAVRCIVSWAKAVGTKATLALQQHQPLPWGFLLSNLILFSNLRRALGLHKCRGMFSGAAPMRPDVLQYFASLYMPVCELYGMSECTGPHSVNLPHRFKLGSCGVTLPGCETTLLDVDETGEGQIAMRGRHVFMGYKDDPKANNDIFTADNFIRTGDLGRVDAGGFITITGRSKELIITAGGENIPPVLIENAIKEELRCVSQAVVVGNTRKYLVCLISFKTEMSVVGDSEVPSDALSRDSLTAASLCGSCARTVQEAAVCPLLQQFIAKGLHRANQRATSHAQHVQKFAVLPADLSVATGEMTGTMKIKRRFVEQKYVDVIEAMYGDRAGIDVHAVASTPTHALASPRKGGDDASETAPFLPKDTDA